ncbi:hypothetical protein TYRP_008375 [Tyrophagus putrescentiae]|nr:hypothetical protein TYRP_008375 [Tyrophagus putrescentiae]
MKLRYALLLCAVAHCALIIAAAAEQQESKYNEIIKLLSDSTEQLKPAAQSYSASVADPNEYSSSGYGRGSSERSRYAPSSSSSSSGGNNKKASADDDDEKKTEEDEEDKKPDRLALLLAESKFACNDLKNGYYADESVGCQVFHYCVDGVKHSWQCPENTVFHQIHLNCVPNTQDICRESSKFHVVNDYLHKELNERGPNNTVLYHQRFYPEGFDVSGGDTVTQIFQAQAAAALQKARERESAADRDSADYEEEQPRPRPRAHHKPSSSSYTPSTQAVRQPLPRQPVYKQPASRPISSYQPQPPPTKRPISSNDDYNSNSNDFSPSSSSSSSSSGSSSSSSPSFSSSSGSNFNSGGSSSGFSPSSSSSSSSPSSAYTSSSHRSQPSSSFRTGSSSSSSRPNYPSRSLGIPIASFRVAPSSSSSSSGYSPVGAQASTIREVTLPLDMPIAFAGNHQQPLQGYYF